MLDVVSDLVLNQNKVTNVYLGEIDYTKNNPYFLLALRFNDGGTTAAYVEHPELEFIHGMLSTHLTVNEWCSVNKVRAPLEKLN